MYSLKFHHRNVRMLTTAFTLHETIIGYNISENVKNTLSPAAKIILVKMQNDFIFMPVDFIIFYLHKFNYIDDYALGAF